MQSLPRSGDVMREWCPSAVAGRGGQLLYVPPRGNMRVVVGLSVQKHKEVYGCKCIVHINERQRQQSPSLV